MQFVLLMLAFKVICSLKALVHPQMKMNISKMSKCFVVVFCTYTVVWTPLTYKISSFVYSPV